MSVRRPQTNSSHDVSKAVADGGAEPLGRPRGRRSARGPAAGRGAPPPSEAKPAGDPQQNPPSPYMSPKEIQNRWRCSRGTVDNIARRNGFSRFCFGEGRNGLVRYLREEVMLFEMTRAVRSGR